MGLYGIGRGRLPRLRLLLHLVVGLVGLVGLMWSAEPAAAFTPWWVQNYRETDLWSGMEGGASSFGRLPQWSYLEVVAPQTGPRLYVFNPATNNYAYVEASAVGPSGAPVVGGSRAAATSVAGVQAGGSNGGGAGFKSWWVENFRETELWSGEGPRALSFGKLKQWSFLSVARPQDGPRLYVYNPLSGNYAYVDASAVGPSGPPPSGGVSGASVGSGSGVRQLPQTAGDYQPWWVSNFHETDLWAGPEPDATVVEKVPQFRRFLVVKPQSGDRLRVWDPVSQGYGYLDASAVGPSGPSVWIGARPPVVVRQVNLPGRTVTESDPVYARDLAVFDEETEVTLMPNNSSVEVKDLVKASDGSGWYLLGDGLYMRTSEVRIPRPLSSVELRSGRWIDADLALPTLVTAYDGNKVVRTMLAIRGITGTPTRPGTFRIERRVEDETMDSETIGIPRDSPKGYLLKHVLYTQYFTDDGAALHYNWWLGKFGFPGSHGCLGLNLEDSKWLWDWATVGTPVVVRDSNRDSMLMTADSVGGGR